MASIQLGNESVVERVKKNPDLDASPDNIDLKPRKDLGRQVTTMSLNEVDGNDNPSRAMNLAMAVRLWSGDSDKPPAWVDGDDDLLVALIADHFGCKTGRPKTWEEG